MTAGFAGVTADPKGTAYAPFQGFPLDTIPVSGKTGTAQVGARAEGKGDTSLFAALLPGQRTAVRRRRGRRGRRSGRADGGADRAARHRSDQRSSRRRAGPGARHGEGLMATITGGFSATRRRSASEASPLQHIDVLLLVLPFVISALGLLMIYSSTRSRLERNGVDPLYFVQRQALAIGLGVVAMVIMIADRLPEAPRPLGTRVPGRAAVADRRARAGRVAQGRAGLVRRRAAAVPTVRDREDRGHHRGRGVLPPTPWRSRRLAARGRGADRGRTHRPRAHAERPRVRGRDRRLRGRHPAGRRHPCSPRGGAALARPSPRSAR